MKKTLLFLFLFNLSFYGFSQEAEETITSTQEDILPTGKNELKLNALYLLLGFPELSYERVLDEESALGISVAFSLEEVFDINFMAIPYYRVYFGNKPAAGFFVEGNGALYSVDYHNHVYHDGYYYDESTSNKFGAGLGLAVGAKFMSKSRWIFEVFGGAGRNFINAEEIGAVYPRFGLTVGKRF